MLNLILILTFPLTASQDRSTSQPDLRGETLQAMKRATTFFRSHIAEHGGYLWDYSLDLKERAGENKATPSQIWIQPPGTPSVGEAFLRAYKATGQKEFLDAAVDAGHALTWGQLATGGWDYLVDFDATKSKAWHYRRDVEAGDKARDKRKCITVFDDDTSQSALRFLMQLDTTLKGADPEIRRAVDYALDHFIEAQYPNGAWPQRYWARHDPNEFPVRKATYPETWSRQYPKAPYAHYYTFNDSTIADCIEMMLMAHQLYGKPEYLASARKGGDFILLAQMPEPQPVWAQQYNPKMEPAWARKFEPPSVTAGESISAMKSLKVLFEKTGDARYLEPLPRALAWYKRSRLPDGKWARFYELKTNKPLYFVKDTYVLTYDGGNTPTHYCFKADWNPAALEKWYEKVTQAPRDQWHAKAKTLAEHARRRAAVDPGTVEKTLRSLDDQGRWVVSGKRIRTQTFISNMRVLSDYLAGAEHEH